MIFWHTMVMLEDCNWYDEFIMIFLRFQFSRLNSPSSAIQLFQSDGLELLIPSRLTAQLDWSLFYLFFAVIVKAFEPLWTGSHFKEIFPVLSGWLNPIGSEIRIGLMRKTIFCATCEGLLLEHVQESTQCQSMSNQYIKNQSLPSWSGTTQTLFWKLFVTPTPPSSWFSFRSKNVCMELWVPRWFTDTGNFIELRPASLSSHVFLFQSSHWNCVMFQSRRVHSLARAGPILTLRYLAWKLCFPREKMWKLQTDYGIGCQFHFYTVFMLDIYLHTCYINFILLWMFKSVFVVLLLHKEW